MKKGLPILISVVVLFSFSCKKCYELEKNAKPYITNPTSYVLKRQIWSGPTTNGQSFLYIYNSDHLVSKIERYNWGNGGSSQTWYDTAHYSFEYTNGLCTKWIIDEGFKGYYVYEYNNLKLPIKRTLYGNSNSGTPQSYSFYKYDNLNNLVEKIDSSSKVNFKYVFTYNSNNNLTSVINNILWSNPQQKEKYEFTAFDNKVNFIQAVNGLPSTFIWDNNYHSYSSSSPNNLVSSNWYTSVNLNQPFGSPNTSNYSYQYNDEGLPSKAFYGPWAITFEYEKYK